MNYRGEGLGEIHTYCVIYEIPVGLANLCKFEPILLPNKGSPLVDWLVIVVEILVVIVGSAMKHRRRN